MSTLDILKSAQAPIYFNMTKLTNETVLGLGGEGCIVVFFVVVVVVVVVLYAFYFNTFCFVLFVC